jgi:hypothetical protein
MGFLPEAKLKNSREVCLLHDLQMSHHSIFFSSILLLLLEVYALAMRTSLSSSQSELSFGRAAANKYVSFVVAQMSFACAAGCCTTDDLPTEDGPITRSGRTTFDGTTDDGTKHNRLVFSCLILLDLL